MSRRKNRQQSTQKSYIDNKKTIINASHNQTNVTANITGNLVDKRDVVYSLVTGAFCIALLFALSEIIHRTNWLTPLIDRFNSLI